MTDKSLIARAAGGDNRIREIIYEKYYHHVYRYCVYRTGSLHDARREILTQDYLAQVIQSQLGTIK